MTLRFRLRLTTALTALTLASPAVAFVGAPYREAVEQLDDDGPSFAWTAPAPDAPASHPMLFREAIWKANIEHAVVIETQPEDAAVAYLTRAAYESGAWEDTAYKAQFAHAVKWSTLGVHDDNGATDPAGAMSALPPYTPIEGDCPNGGTVIFSQWVVPSGLKIMWDDGCRILSTNTTLGVYGIVAPANTLATTPPATDIEMYNFDGGYVTAVSKVRMFEFYINHFKFKHYHLSNTGGVGLIRGSDREITFGKVENTITDAGNPGWRDIGNVPLVETSPGMEANVVYEWLDEDVGDALAQACQSATNPLTWLYGVSTDGMLFKHIKGRSHSSAFILVNEAVTGAGNYYCRNIVFEDFAGRGRWGIISGDSDQETSNVTYRHGVLDAEDAVGYLPFVGIGDYAYGGHTADAPNTHQIVVDDLTINSPFITALGVSNADARVNALTVHGPRAGLTSPAATVTLDGSGVMQLTNSSVDAGQNIAAVSVGTNSPAPHATLSNVAAKGVADGKAGFLYGAAANASQTGGSVTPAVGSTLAQGIALTTGANGTTGAQISGVDVTQMPVPVVPALGQGNRLTGNPGAPDYTN